ncbi:MAG: efflux RND transporter periplasmic adaptor subunit [Gammaproteobacteria bacterium]|nr:efflux RND transporter periplasmic adaptor subunit [Gammaproteobacteria bacterium]MDH3778104.1 efflux RND transporter periplasmic adaptor subunit [Gammaproteobacteria bacterium]MDH3811140.1 efflux RND transporter periplasmic adaptor subunit [Gammaproteobacteria bacterium]
MKIHKFVQVNLLIALTGAFFLAAGCESPPSTDSGNGHGAAAEDDFERGPHNGRMLRDGDFALEITIFETGVPPEFRVYPYSAGQPLDPKQVDLTIELGRLGPRTDRFEFAGQDDFLRGDGVVLEPHSFDVAVRAQVDGASHEWSYDSYEGRTQIKEAVAEAMGIAVETAGSESIRETITLQGTIAPHPEAIVEVRGQYPGLVRSLSKSVGDTVTRGEELARIQSNESLQVYAVNAPISGTVVARDAVIGSASTDAPLYVVVDLSRLVADLSVFSQDLGEVAAGQAVVVSSLDGAMSFTGTIDRILPTIDSLSRAATARVIIENAEEGWRPGLFVEGVVTVAETSVPLAVRESGLQSFRDFTVVYARVGDTYEVRMLELGKRDGEFVEVLGGLEPGTTYVFENSYLVKADVEKSGASHDH